MTIASGSRIGSYEIVAPLGAGGMGEVYRARDAKLGREVAIKVLPAAVAEDPGRRQRFEQEARAASSLNHPNILTIHDIAEADGALYIAMELVEGKTLRELAGCRDVGRIAPVEPREVLLTADRIDGDDLAPARGDDVEDSPVGSFAPICPADSTSSTPSRESGAPGRRSFRPTPPASFRSNPSSSRRTVRPSSTPIAVSSASSS